MYKLQHLTWICIWQVLPDNKCCQMWLILWLFENICGCWQKQQPRKEKISKQKLHFHHRWKCSKNLDFQATFWQSLAGPYFCRFLSILSHMWTELSFLAKIQTAKTTLLVKYKSSRWLKSPVGETPLWRRVKLDPLPIPNKSHGTTENFQKILLFTNAYLSLMYANFGLFLFKNEIF